MMTVTAAPTPAALATVRVLVVDDHPALRAGLEGLLSNEPGIECVGALESTVGLLAAVRDLRPDVVVLDYALGADDGLSTCFRIKQLPHPPAVVLYSAYVHDVFAVPAAIARADATVSKSAPIDDLLFAIDAAAAGTVLRPEPDPERVHAASAPLLTEDLPVATMLIAGTSIADIADVLDTTTADLRDRALRVIGRLQAGHAADGPEPDATADSAGEPRTPFAAAQRGRQRLAKAASGSV
jgi:DNA-binding NarL/FixJ family response regulator